MPCNSSSAYELQLPQSPEALEQFRAGLRGWLSKAGASEREEFEILTATGEAVANAIEHPLDASFSLVDVTAADADGSVTISVHDSGSWQAPRLRAEGGYGFTLMRSLMDTVEVARDQEGTTVVMTRMLGR